MKFPVFQPPQCSLRPSECRDLCRNHHLQTGCDGLHHLDLLLQETGDEPQVGKYTLPSTTMKHGRVPRLPLSSLSWTTAIICFKRAAAEEGDSRHTC